MLIEILIQRRKNSLLFLFLLPSRHWLTCQNRAGNPGTSALVMHSKSASAGPRSDGRTANSKQSHSSQWMVVLCHVSRSLLTQ